MSAVVGGVLANDLLKAVAKKGEPIRNLFMYSLSDGIGSVELYGCQEDASPGQRGAAA